MNYHRALESLNLRGNEVLEIHLGLHRIATVMQSVGKPQEKYPVLHIAGTNGKGSVAAMAESILRNGGCRTGLYISPHLLRLEERIRVAGREISARHFAARITQILQNEVSLIRHRQLDRPLTYFELVTACAFLEFAEQKVDIAVIEAGLGGSLDATNVVTPDACVITSISYDHQNLLGNTLAQIAGEKAGIIKTGVPVISGCRPLEARRVIRTKAREVGAPLIELGKDCIVTIRGEYRGRYTMDLKTPRRLYRKLRLSLAGEHQVRNAALAVAAVEALEWFPIRMRQLRQALAETCWPGRIDEYRARRRTVLDGAHNPEAALTLRNYLRQQRHRIHLVFGALRDKDIRSMSKHLFPLAERIYLAPVKNIRSADPRDIAFPHARFGGRLQIHTSARDALRSAWGQCPKDGLVVVTGSLYLVGELLPVVQAEANACLQSGESS